MSTPSTVMIAGVGPGLGAALARRFAQAGHPTALGARSKTALMEITSQVSQAGGVALTVPYDVTDDQAVTAAIGQVQSQLGPIATFIYNAGNQARGGVQDLSSDAFTAAWQVGPYGAFLHAKQLLPKMAAQGGGVMLFTGATSSVHAPAKNPAFASAKFGLRGLAMSLMREWGPKGVHVAHVLVDGVILTPRVQSEVGDQPDYLRTEDIAEAYYQLALQPPSAWTFELDLRPFTDDYFEN